MNKYYSKPIFLLSMVIILILVPASKVFAVKSLYNWGIGIAYGTTVKNINIHHIGISKTFQKTIDYKNNQLHFYVDGSVTTMHHGNEAIWGIGISPVLVCTFKTKQLNFKPYVEIGCGPSCFNKTMISDRDLSSNLLFEDRIGAGIRIHPFDIGIRYMHYSNASLKKPNDGIDIMMLFLTWYF